MLFSRRAAKVIILGTQLTSIIVLLPASRVAGGNPDSALGGPLPVPLRENQLSRLDPAQDLNTIPAAADAGDVKSWAVNGRNGQNGLSAELAISAIRQNRFRAPQHQLRLLLRHAELQKSVEAAQDFAHHAQGQQIVQGQVAPVQSPPAGNGAGNNTPPAAAEAKPLQAPLPASASRVLQGLNDMAVPAAGLSGGNLAANQVMLDPNMMMQALNSFVNGFAGVANVGAVALGATTTTPPPAHQVMRGFLSILEGIQRFNQAGNSILGDLMISQQLGGPAH